MICLLNNCDSPFCVVYYKLTQGRCTWYLPMAFHGHDASTNAAATDKNKETSGDETIWNQDITKNTSYMKQKVGENIVGTCWHKRNKDLRQLSQVKSSWIPHSLIVPFKIIWGVPKMEVLPNHLLKWDFPPKPTIWGYPHLRPHPWENLYFRQKDHPVFRADPTGGGLKVLGLDGLSRLDGGRWTWETSKNWCLYMVVHAG